MWFVLYGEWGDCVAEFNTEAEAEVYIASRRNPDDYWLGCDDLEAGVDDYDLGFDPYMGCYSYDC